MYRTLVLVACVSALTALVIGGGAFASASSSGGGVRTITLIEKSTSGKYVDLGPKGFSVGDEFVFSSDFWNAAQTHKVGRSDGYCVILSHTRDHCVATASFDGGTLEVAGGSLIDAKTFSLAVTGGTGKYRGAEGQVTIHSLTGTVSRDVIELVD